MQGINPMIKDKLLPGIAVLILLSGQLLPAAAQLNAEKLYQHLQAAYDRHEEALSGYLITELSTYGLTFPDSSRAADASWLLAKVYLDKGKKNEALAAAFKTLYLYPLSPHESDCRDMVQSILLKENSYSEKKELLESAIYGTAAGADCAQRWRAYLTFLKDLDQPRLDEWFLAEARTFITRFPDDPQIYPVLQWIADLYAKLDQKYEAIYSYRKLEEIYPGDSRLPYALSRQAQLLCKKVEKYDEAIGCCTKIITNYPTSEFAPAAAFMIGEIKEEKLKDHTGAIEAYRKMVDTYSQDAKAVDALLAIGEIHQKKLKNSESALLTYEELVKKYQSSPLGAEALVRSGDIYAAERKEYLNAAASYARISELYPTDEKAPQMLIKAGNLCEEKLKDFRKAIDYYQIVLDKYPDSKKAGDAKEKITKATAKL
jgi:TolA-binding protein